jgi:glycosidase
LERPNVHEYLNEMNRKVLSHYDVMTVGEMPGDLNPYEASKYVAKERKELSMVFQFSHMTIVSRPH